MGAFKVMLTDDQIRAAYERRRRPSWPGFEQAMAQRGFALQVMTDAWSHERAKQAFVDKQQQRAWRQRTVVPQTLPKETPVQASLIPAHAPLMDRKRRASGERDDD
jgi:hypothetical protein